ncbi:MAG: hypothetical protein IPM16_15270 [Chloroflexi bacterium]|nr:hypothetical protein [Chloroflexota bacterium]
MLNYNDYLLTETLYAAVLSAAFAAAQVGMRRLNASRGIGWGVLLGVLFGAAALTRGTLGAVLLPVMLVYIVWRYKARAVVYAGRAGRVGRHDQSVADLQRADVRLGDTVNPNRPRPVRRQQSMGGRLVGQRSRISSTTLQVRSTA